MNKVAIYGGLGNQMFQYCLHLHFKKHNIPSDLSLSDFLNTYHHNGFDLPRAFHLSLSSRSRAINAVLQHAEPLYRNRLAHALLRRLVPRYEGRRTNVIRENREFHFNPLILQQRNACLIGTWQATEYLEGNDELIRKEFRFREPADEQNRRIAARIKQTNAVSIHIRRGDYQKQEWIGTHAVIKGLTYYKNAIDHIEARVESPHYFIFSDDMQWVKDNLQLKSCTFVDHNKGRNSYIDMYLMSLCRHNIIANSTFSWWAAWLNTNPGKIVIMPERWLNNISAPGIFPRDWLTFPV